MNSQELTAPEIFDLLLSGKKVGQVASCANDPNLVRLLGHLNVIKCRSRKVYLALDLEWSNSVISTEPKLSKAMEGQPVIFQMSLPKAPKKYSSFIIIENVLS